MALVRPPRLCLLLPVSRSGGTDGEKQAFRVYWRQMIAVANARGVAGVIHATHAHLHWRALAAATPSLLALARLLHPHPCVHAVRGEWRASERT